MTWYTPPRLLALLCAIHLLIAIDRGVIPSNGVNGAPATAESEGRGIQGEFGLTLFQDGLLPAAFFLGLLVASPAFAQASKRRSPSRLVGAGLAVYTVASLGCGLALGFASLLLGWAAMGAGQAALVVLATPLIDDHAPPAKKARWLALFSITGPTGSALGYIWGGLVGATLGRRAVFLAGAMAPFAAFYLRAAPLGLRQMGGGGRQQQVPQQQWRQQQRGPDAELGQQGAASEEVELLAVRQDSTSDCDEAAVSTAGLPSDHLASSPGSAAPPLDSCGGARAGSLQSVLASCSSDTAAGTAASAGAWADLRQLAAHPVYLLLVGGGVFLTGALGMLGYYAPKASQELFQVAPEVADVALGGITVCTGIVGTYLGGLALDRMGGGLRTALLICALGISTGGLLYLLGFLAAPGFALFCAAMAGGDLATFMAMAPGSAALMWSVPPGLRAFGLSTWVVVHLLLGTVPGPPLLGLLQGRLANWRVSMAVPALLLLGGGALDAVAMLRARTAVDYNAAALVGGGQEAGQEGGRWLGSGEHEGKQVQGANG